MIFLVFVCLDEEARMEGSPKASKDKQSTTEVGSAKQWLIVVYIDDKDEESHLMRAVQQDG